MRDLILASGSARRKDILEMLGIPFEIVVSEFPEEEVLLGDFDNPSEYVATLAMGKALMVAEKYEDALILGADTTVWLEGKYYNKPENLDEAREILKALRGKTHKVVTGMALIDTLTGERRVETVETGVTFLPVSDSEIERYIQTSESLGKAGAYAIQMGAKGFVRAVEGSLSNVVGLPMTEVAAILEEAGMPIEVDVRRLEEERFSFGN